MTLLSVMGKIKTEYEETIRTASFNGSRYKDGLTAKEALIRSQRLINHIHELIKNQLVQRGIDVKNIVPTIGESRGEIELSGFLKKKKQDVCVFPQTWEVKTSTRGVDDEEILSINVRSQLSSLAKNFDTLYERTFAEALNLHLAYPRQCLGDVYLIPTKEYSDVDMKRNLISYRAATNVDNYIRKFQAINGRSSAHGDEYKYERICLLIVDFSKNPVKIYQEDTELLEDGIINSSSNASMKGLEYSTFVDDLLNTYHERFGRPI